MKKKLASTLISIVFCLFFNISQADDATNTTSTTDPGDSYLTDSINTTNTTNTTDPLLQALTAQMSLRSTRYHHYLWHNMRDNWNSFTPEIQQEFTDLGWAPPRPAIAVNADGTTSVITDNGSGEDFLYMHSQMIALAKSIVGNDSDIVASWTTLPAPNDTQYPVPSPYTIPYSNATTASTANQKSDDFYNKNIAPLEATFTNPEQLRNMTLGELGSRLEFTVHNWLHMRFSNVSAYGYRSGYKGTIPYIDPMWDDPQYSWLGDFYSSQVDPVFWKLHGWVNDRVEDWRVANNLTEIIWNGTWTGGPLSSLSSVLDINSTNTTNLTTNSTARLLTSAKEGSGMANLKMNHGGCGSGTGEVGDILEKVMQVFMGKWGRETSFADPVQIDDFVPESLKYKPPKSSEKNNQEKNFLN